MVISVPTRYVGAGTEVRWVDAESTDGDVPLTTRDEFNHGNTNHLARVTWIVIGLREDRE
jgi:hypothetical protein